MVDFKYKYKKYKQKYYNLVHGGHEDIPYMTKDNYKEFYNQWLILQKDKDYKGKRTYFPILQTAESNIAGSSRYSNYNAIRDSEDNLMSPPDPTKETINQFLERAKFKNFGGSSTHEHLVVHNKIMRQVKPKKIMEIGFNTGISASNFLDFDPDITVLSFDIMMRFYNNYAKWYIDKKYPGRHFLIAGDSTVSLPAYHKFHPEYKADIIFIDGSHLLAPAFFDIKNSYDYAHENTILIIDNVIAHRTVGSEVYDALLRAIQDEGIVNFIDHIETGDYKDGFAICKYNIKPEDKFKTGKIDYLYIERRIPAYYYSYLINDTNEVETLVKIKEELEEKIKKNPDGYDMYVINDLNNKLKELGASDRLMSKFEKKGKIWNF